MPIWKERKSLNFTRLAYRVLFVLPALLITLLFGAKTNAFACGGGYNWRPPIDSVDFKACAYLHQMYSARFKLEHPELQLSMTETQQLEESEQLARMVLNKYHTLIMSKFISSEALKNLRKMLEQNNESELQKIFSEIRFSLPKHTVKKKGIALEETSLGYKTNGKASQLLATLCYQNSLLFSLENPEVCLSFTAFDLFRDVQNGHASKYISDVMSKSSQSTKIVNLVNAKALNYKHAENLVIEKQLEKAGCEEYELRPRDYRNWKN